ncbi:MAG: c-type cytochrome [Nitrospiria bacterium]
MKRIISSAVGIGSLLGVIILLSSCGGSKLAKQGAKLYAYYCTHCHGAKGQGNGYNAVNLDPKPRDHTDGGEPYMAGRTNEELFEAIEKGGRGIGKSPFMPVFGGIFSEQEIWALVAHLRRLHSNDAPPVVVPPDATTERPKFPRVKFVSFEPPGASGVEVKEEEAGETDEDAEEDADEEDEDFEDEDDEEEEEEAPDPDAWMARQVAIGKRLFEEQYGCISCHRNGETGGAVGPSLVRVGFRLRPKYIFEWIKNPQAIKPDTKMPNFMLKDRDALAITLYLRTLKGEIEGPPELRAGRP